ncbi:MYB DNA-binding domain-containing protein [Apiospora arundinis]|uniref:MYB DNA-binding domain-containing protein n=1 Tax=Apiospora arundinis TaxID=335852 RepID=A0ABR2I9Z3_9PEZI
MSVGPNVCAGPAPASDISVRRTMTPQVSELPAKKRARWSAEEDSLVIELRENEMDWADISKRLPGRSQTSCRCRYEKHLDKRVEERKNTLATLYERFKSEMWTKIADEMEIPWKKVEEMYWRLGKHDLARRAGVVPSPPAVNRDRAKAKGPPRGHSDSHSQRSLPRDMIDPTTKYGRPPSISQTQTIAGHEDSMLPRMPAHLKHGPGGYELPPPGGALMPMQVQSPQEPGMLPSLAELMAGVRPYSPSAALIGVPSVSPTQSATTGPGRFSPIIAYAPLKSAGSKRRGPDLTQTDSACNSWIRKRPRCEPQERYYQYLEDLAFEPLRVLPNGQRAFGFGLTDETLIRMASSKDVRIRLQCFLKKPDTISIPKEKWRGNETAWPKQIQVHLNKHLLTPTSKQPIDLTQHACCGINHLQLYFALERSPIAVPFIAVEVVTICSHSSILNSTPATLPDQTLGIIQQRLKSSSGGIDEDELSILTDGIRIKLTDPFSLGRIETPVRGRTCSHLECFDLETWLATRPKECICNNGGKDCQVCPSVAYNWKCPICDGDARPQELRIDGFLSEVIAQLQDQTAKSIVVRGDLSWNLIQDSNNEESDENDGYA